MNASSGEARPQVHWPPSRLTLARTIHAERAVEEETALDRWARSLWLSVPRARSAARAFAAEVSTQSAAWAARDDDEVRAAARAAAAPAFTGDDPKAGALAVALVCEAAARTLGWRAHPPQRLAAWRLLGGRLVELDTGEGKTLVAALAACIAALAGVPTHVVTVNDYLAGRDAQTMRPLFAFFGLGVGLVHGTVEQERRAQAYAQPVTYCTNKELVFDYLRDGVASGGVRSHAQQSVQRLHAPARSEPGLRLRGLHFAIVDEADSVLIDEARTPMILASPRGLGGGEAVYREFLDFAAALRPGLDFRCIDAQRLVELRESGRALLARRAEARVQPSSEAAGDVWAIGWAREQLAVQALRALHTLHRDRHYVVRDRKVVIVDECTGRLLADRSWEQGLHQLVEIKEGCPPTGMNQTLARLTSQGFFSRYLRLSGMSGTVREIAREAGAVLGLRTERVERHRSCRRTELPGLLYPDQASKHVAIVAEVRRHLALGQAVLVGTASVRASNAVSGALGDANITHRVLNALQDEHEAELVAQAGQRGAVTVATDMAGRGTDIVLDREVIEGGGLHVVLTEWHESARIDRQLFGRCARQSDPGSCRAIASLVDDLVQANASREARWIARCWGAKPPSVVIRWLRRTVQARAERAAARQRRMTMEHDRQLRAQLAFSGDGA